MVKPDGAEYSVQNRGSFQVIRHLSSGDCMYMRGASPYVTRYCDPNDATAHWIIDGLR